MSENKTINLMPSWENLWHICKDGEFPKVYEELLKPCKVFDMINKSLDEGRVVIIYKNDDGEVMFDDGSESEQDLR